MTEPVVNGNQSLGPQIATASSTTLTKIAAPKKEKLMLTDLERIVFERCLETGDTAKDSLEYDDKLHSSLLVVAYEGLRETRIQARLENDLSWVKQQVAKLRAGVRNPGDEPNEPGASGAPVYDPTGELQDLAVRRGLDEHSESWGMPSVDADPAGVDQAGTQDGSHA